MGHHIGYSTLPFKSTSPEVYLEYCGPQHCLSPILPAIYTFTKSSLYVEAFLICISWLNFSFWAGISNYLLDCSPLISQEHIEVSMFKTELILLPSSCSHLAVEVRNLGSTLSLNPAPTGEGRIMDPLRSPHSNATFQCPEGSYSYATLYGEGDLADTIEVKALEMENCFGLSWWTQFNVEPFKAEERGWHKKRRGRRESKYNRDSTHHC